MLFPSRIEVTVIDKVGRHHVLRGLEGQNLASLLDQHADTLGDDVVGNSPEGRGKAEAHVKVPNELLKMLPASTSEEQRYLAEFAESSSLDKHSRLASRILLDQRMQGALVSLSDLKPWKTL